MTTTAKLEGLLRRRWLPAFTVAVVAGHLTAVLLAGFTTTSTVGPIVAAVLGFLAVPLASWEISLLVDWLFERIRARGLLGAMGRIVVGMAFIALVPTAFTLLKQVPIDALGRALELGALGLSVGVATGLVLVALGLADVLYSMTTGLRHLSTRLMVLLVFAAFGTVAWLSLLGVQAQRVLLWAAEQGKLEHFVEVLDLLDDAAGAYVGGVAGAIGLQLPFILLLAWRFGTNATRGLADLRAGFDRVARGDLDEPVLVEGNDEVADMQRGFNEMLLVARERRFLESAFGRYLSPVVVDRLKAAGESALKHSERRTATVMFTDIRGFTAMSAELPPEGVIALLNRYMSVLIETVAAYDGYINKFVGDAMLVVWNAPLDQADHAARALRCAAAMQDAVRRANEAGVFGPRRVEMGVGVNTGALVMGHLGNERQAEFTVIGDTVNVASRACSAAGKGQIAVTRETMEHAVAIDRALEPRFASLGERELKGKGKVELFSFDAAGL